MLVQDGIRESVLFRIRACILEYGSAFGAYAWLMFAGVVVEEDTLLKKKP